jgi:hypothetical protein
VVSLSGSPWGKLPAVASASSPDHSQTVPHQVCVLLLSKVNSLMTAGACIMDTLHLRDDN